MIEILEMRDGEMYDLLRRVGYGHLACSLDDQPYVFRIYFSYEGGDIFIYTTSGKKSMAMDKNPKVCLQVEEFTSNALWRSVVVMGEAHRLLDASEREAAVDLIRQKNPSFMPALAIKWSNDWIQKNVEAVYRIEILSMTGRMSSEVRVASTAAHPIYGSPKTGT